MPSPFDKVLTAANAIGPDGKLTEAEKQKFINSVESIIRRGSTVPGLEFPADPFADETVKRIKESSSWKKTYVDGLLEPSVKSLNTPGNIPLFPVHDISTTFNVNIDLNELSDPTKFTPPELAIKSGLTPPEVAQKLTDITANLPVPQLPQVPPLPTPDGILEKFEIKKEDLKVEAVKLPDLTNQPVDFFGKLLKSPIDLFTELISDPQATLDAAIGGSLGQLIFGSILLVVKLAIAALGVVISTMYVLVATILAWVYRIVSAIAASIVSAIVGTGSISTSVYNTQLTS